MRNIAVFVCVILVLSFFLFGCAATVYVPESPPPVKIEVKPAPPGPHAVWIDGHWRWSHGVYVWAPGHWVRKSHRQWVPGHWDKRPHGWIWIEGHWRP